MAVELTDEEAAAARRAVQIVAALQNSPEARPYLESGLKVLDPKFTTSADAAERITAPLKAEIEAMRAEREAEKLASETARKEREDAEILGRMEAAFSRLRSQGLTAEGEERVKEIMRDRTIPDPEAAFALFERQNPKPIHEESSWTPDRWNYDTDAVGDTTKALFANPEKWGDDMIGQVLLDERRPRGDGN